MCRAHIWWACALLLAGVLSAQRAPCYQCERYMADHPSARPYEQIRSQCTYPCTCPASSEPLGPLVCDNGATPVLDSCDCCPTCPLSAAGDPCGPSAPCDRKLGLTCRLAHRTSTHGVCAYGDADTDVVDSDGDSDGGIGTGAMMSRPTSSVVPTAGTTATGLPCVVNNRTISHGDTFLLDCRTQCACQNGTYGCSSLCPQEHISPRGSCRHPRLVDLPGQCCRQWICDSQEAQQPPKCNPMFSRWSPCSSPCGAGLSHRESNLNALCESATENRLCQERRCDDFPMSSLPSHSRLHHVRKGHECKATQRVSEPVRFRFGPCRSRKHFRPKYCGSCSTTGMCCEPRLSTTVKIEFICDDLYHELPENTLEVILEHLEPSQDLWVPLVKLSKDGGHRPHRSLFVNIQWILKCECGPKCSTDRSESITSNPVTGPEGMILHRVHRTAAP